MSELVPPDAAVSPAAARNRDPIAEVLRPRLPAVGTVLELASGSGEHAVHNARAFPRLDWQPSDFDLQALASIAAWRRQTELPNLLEPVRIDATAPETWPLARADAVVCINMIHISPWAATEGLMRGASRLLPPGGGLFLYGPYLEDGVETAPSNLAFDQSLKDRDPRWGLRRLEEVTALAAAHGLAFEERIAMPANNLVVIYRKS
jgi:SAM-dependent methyltransferase